MSPERPWDGSILFFFFFKLYVEMILQAPLPHPTPSSIFPEINLLAQGEVGLPCWSVGQGSLAPQGDISQ